jgi:hypothetical protein
VRRDNAKDKKNRKNKKIERNHKNLGEKQKQLNRRMRCGGWERKR